MIMDATANEWFWYLVLTFGWPKGWIYDEFFWPDNKNKRQQSTSAGLNF